MYYLKKAKKPKEKKSSSGIKKPSVAALVRKLDRIFSEYIRLRDSRAYGYKYFRCISCNKILPFEMADAGHFIGRTHMSTRFDEQNVWCECRGCNRFSADHMIYYQRNLEQKIGKTKVDLLIARGKQTKKWTTWELDILIRHFSAEVDRMKQERDGIKH